jgi:uncharacterized membrane protein
VAREIGHDATALASSLSLRHLVAMLFILMGGCQRQPRAREREAAEAEAKARAHAAEAARRAAEPLPQEPPIEMPRVAHSGLPCKVDDVFATKCRRCHTIPTRHGAPFVFLTWEDTRQDRLGQPLYAVIGRAVRTNFMPYRVEANPPVEQLTDDEKKIILDWVDAGAPREECDPNAPKEKKPITASPRAASSASAKPKR